MTEAKLEPFVADVAKIRLSARGGVALGAVTAGYRGDRLGVVAMLNDALATELVCVLRYRRHYFVAQALANPAVVGTFLEHSSQELAHADRLAARIVQLNGEPDLDPSRLTARSHTEYMPGTTLVEMLREDVVAERIGIDSYRAMILWLGDRDPTTRRMLEEILAVEEEHADEMSDLLAVAVDAHSAAAPAAPELSVAAEVPVAVAPPHEVETPAHHESGRQPGGRMV